MWRWSWRTFLLLSLSLSIPLCKADDEMPCTIHHGGRYYDLNPLKSNRDYDFKTPGGHTVTINVCRRPAKESFGLKDVDDSKVAGFVRRDHQDFSIGEVNTTLSMQGSNLRLTLTGGSKCNLRDTNRNTDLRASTLVDFVCDTSVFGTGEPTLVAQFPQGSDDEGVCGYVLEWRTHIACPTNEPGGVWGFFGFLIFTIIGIALLYLVAGTLYNRFVLRLSGWDQIPKFSIESMKYHASEAIDWVKDLTGIGHGRYHYPIPGHDGEREQEEGLLGSGGRSANSNLNTPFSGGSTAFPRSAQGSGRLNPVSHHAQVSSPPSGTAAPSDSVGGGGGVGGFVRPHISRTPSAPGKKTEINPVSHQAQLSAAKSLNPPTPPDSSAAVSSTLSTASATHIQSPPLPSAPTAASTQPESSESMTSMLVPSSQKGKEKEKHRPEPFELGDDDDEEGDLASASPVPAKNITEERGRDLGSEGTIRL